MMKKLPPNDYPIYTFEIPSTGVKHRFRPFLVKEQKALLVAQGSDSETSMIETLKHVINDCCMENDFDVDKLAVFDVEYLLIKLRSISVSKEAEVVIKCDNKDEPEHKCDVVVDMDNLTVVGIKKDKTVKLSNNKAVVMKYPNIDVVSILCKEDITIDDYTDLFMLCVDSVVVGDEVFKTEELSKEDLKNWIDTLDNESFEKIVDFLKDFPYTQLKVEWDCKKCGKHNVRYLVGLESFF